MTEEIVTQLIRSSTPALNEYSSRPLLLSTIENVDEEVNRRAVALLPQVHAQAKCKKIT